MDWFSWEQCASIINSVLSMGWVKLIASFIGLAVAWIFDDTRGYMPAIIVASLIALDSVSGMVAAVHSGEGLSSQKSKRIIIKFVIYGIAISTGRLVDKLMPLPAFAVVIETALALTEAQSIIENCGKAGMPVPVKIKNLFKTLKDK